MALRLIRVAVVGAPKGIFVSNTKVVQGVGKSCFCNRFVNSERYREDHRSNITGQEWQGAVVSQEHNLYWGAVTKFHPFSGRIRFQVIEYTEFVDRKSGIIFPFEVDYIRRVCHPAIGNCKSFEYRPENYINSKVAYQVNLDEEEISPEERNPFSRRRSSSVTHQALYPEDGKSGVWGYICVYDPTIPSADGGLQRQIDFLRHLIVEIGKLKKPIVIVCSKCDHPDATKQNIKIGKTELAKKRNIPFIEISSRENVNVEEAFFSLVMSTRRRKTIGLPNRTTSSQVDIPTYQEVNLIRHKELKMAKNRFKELLKARVTIFGTYWEEIQPQLEKEPEYKALLNLEDVELLRKMFCNHLMELKLGEVNQRFAQLHSGVSNGDDQEEKILGEKMKYSQSFLKEAIASHPDLDTSSLYEFVKPKMEPPEENGSIHERPQIQGLEDPTKYINGNGPNEPIVSISPESDPSLEESLEVCSKEVQPRNTLKQRSKSHIFLRSARKMRSSFFSEKDPPSSGNQFYTLPRKGKKQKSKKKKNTVDVESTDILSFEDNGQYSEENPPPLPPRPQELPPIQQRQNVIQSKMTELEFPDNHNSAPAGFSITRRANSCGSILEDSDEESNLDILPRLNTVGNASPYEVPQNLLKVEEKSRAEDLNTKQSADSIPTGIYGDSFGLPSKRIGLKQILLPEASPQVPPQQHKGNLGIFGHKRSGSYDQSLGHIQKDTQSSAPPQLSSNSLRYPTSTHSSLSVPRRRPAVSPERAHSSQLDYNRNSAAFKHSYTKHRPKPNTNSYIAEDLKKTEDEFHFRQSSLPDFLAAVQKEEEELHTVSCVTLTSRHHHKTSNGSEQDSVMRSHPLAETVTRTKEASERVEQVSIYDSKMADSDFETQRTVKSSSEERQYAVVSNSIGHFEPDSSAQRRRISTYFDVDGKEINIYEQIDDSLKESIAAGKSAFSTPTTGFPAPISFPSDPDPEMLKQIQDWHNRFMRTYHYFMLELDKIVKKGNPLEDPKLAMETQPSAQSLLKPLPEKLSSITQPSSLATARPEGTSERKRMNSKSEVAEGSLVSSSTSHYTAITTVQSGSETSINATADTPEEDHVFSLHPSKSTDELSIANHLPRPRIASMSVGDSSCHKSVSQYSSTQMNGHTPNSKCTVTHSRKVSIV